MSEFAPGRYAIITKTGAAVRTNFMRAVKIVKRIDQPGLYDLGEYMMRVTENGVYMTCPSWIVEAEEPLLLQLRFDDRRRTISSRLRPMREDCMVLLPKTDEVR